MAVPWQCHGSAMADVQGATRVAWPERHPFITRREWGIPAPPRPAAPLSCYKYTHRAGAGTRRGPSATPLAAGWRWRAGVRNGGDQGPRREWASVMQVMQAPSDVAAVWSVQAKKGVTPTAREERLSMADTPLSPRHPKIRLCCAQTRECCCFSGEREGAAGTATLRPSRAVDGRMLQGSRPKAGGPNPGRALGLEGYGTPEGYLPARPAPHATHPPPPLPGLSGDSSSVEDNGVQLSCQAARRLSGAGRGGAVRATAQWLARGSLGMA